ncbi:MAG: hypothetical protein HYX75_22665 [Acidobacteria bacterium]|nr:hypothetical protein [Acidobacteriota bacterium]
MKSIAVRIECAAEELGRIRDALRLCTGLAIGGIAVTVTVSGGALGVVVDAQRNTAGTDDIAAQLAGFRDVSLKIRCDRDQARGAGIDIPADDLFVAVEGTTHARMDSGARGLIVFSPHVAPTP